MAAPVTLCGSLSLHPSGLGLAMHAAGYRALGLPFVYVPFAVTDLEGAVRGVRALGVRGCGVSMPFKLAVIPLLDALSPLAERIGAVNTIVNEGGRLVGHNTDAEGALRALEEIVEVPGREVLVLGAGGAARAIAFALVGAGARVTLANRDEAKARELAAHAGANARALAGLESTEPWDVLVNATSLGMRDVDPTPPLEPARVHVRTVVMDIVYKPVETELVRRLRARRAGEGGALVTGERMLLHQAARQFELYTGVSAPLEAMEAGLRAALPEAGA